MRLASDQIVIRHGNVVLRLRPSLGAAIQLHADHGLPVIMAGIADRKLGIILDVVTAATDASTAQALAVALTRDGYCTIETLVEPLTDYVLALLGVDRNTNPSAKPAAATDWISSFIEDLFEQATGWLGWSPDHAWYATPREIEVAMRGHIAKLKAIHGSSDKTHTDLDPAAEVAPAEVQKGIAKLASLAMQVQP